MKESRHRRPLSESLASLSIAITSKRSSSESLASLSGRDQQTKQTELSSLPLTGALAPFLPTTQFQKPRVCILGGGFGALYTALRLESLAWPDNKKPQIHFLSQLQW